MTVKRAKPSIAISADKGIPKLQLERLAQLTALPLLNKTSRADYLLHIKTEHLQLQKHEPLHSKTAKSRKKQKKPLSIYADFVTGKAQHRRLHGGGKGQNIARAVGLHKISNPRVLDLTAGLGADAFVLATLGCQVTLVERNLIIYALLKDALERARLCTDPDLQAILGRMSLHNENAGRLLDGLDTQALPDVIYLDPMFPEKQKSAQVKKEMQFLHEIVGADSDSEAVFLKALAKARKRIVVKRPKLAPGISGQIKADFVIRGKSTRYDVYLPRQISTQA